MPAIVPTPVPTAQPAPSLEPVFHYVPTACPDCGGRLVDVVDFGCHFLECEFSGAAYGSRECWFTFSVTGRAQ